MTVQGMPSFYVLLNQNFHESCLFLTYNTFHWTNNTEWKQLNLAQTLLKAALIHQENRSENSLEPIDSGRQINRFPYYFKILLVKCSIYSHVFCKTFRLECPRSLTCFFAYSVETGCFQLKKE